VSLQVFEDSGHCVAYDHLNEIVSKIIEFVNGVKLVKLSNGEEYAYREFNPDGKKTIILVHGNANSSANMDLFYENLKAEYRIIAPDLRGYGHSSFNKPFSSLDELADDVHDLASQLGIKSAVLLGWSLGGGVSLKIASRFPDFVEKLILHCSMGLDGTPFFKMDEKFQWTTERCKNIDEIKSHLLVIMAKKRNSTKDIKQMENALKIGVYNGLKVPEESRFIKYCKGGVLQRNDAEALYALNNSFNMTDSTNGVVDGSNEVKNIKCQILAFFGKKDILVSYKTA
jgi:2-hydroxy-6-oxonona-2,4-dienedioate hydrolase